MVFFHLSRFSPSFIQQDYFRKTVREEHAGSNAAGIYGKKDFDFDKTSFIFYIFGIVGLPRIPSKGILPQLILFNQLHQERSLSDTRMEKIR